jgi:hypothetical protein
MNERYYILVKISFFFGVAGGGVFGDRGVEE